MTASVLMFASAAIIFALGAIHLMYTISGTKLAPRDPALQQRMRAVSPVVTNETTIWRCWVGLNVSHSIAGMLFGFVYGFLAIAHANLLFGSPYLLVIGLLLVGGLCAVAKACWFSSPFIGAGIALVCYVASVIAALAGNP